MKTPDNNFKPPEKNNEIPKQNLYENPNPEQESLNKIYYVVQEWYYRTMFEAPSQWVGYSSGLGFEIPNTVFEFNEPSLQKILSLLNNELSVKKVSLEEIKPKLQAVIEALEKFNPDTDIVENSRQDFLESNTAEHINKVKEALKIVLADVSVDRV